MSKKYFIDFEFMEGFRKLIWWLPTIGWFNKKYWTIEMISIGIFCEDGSKYYAINKNFNHRYANDWVKKNVISQLPEKYSYEAIDPDPHEYGAPTRYVATLNPLYKSIDQIKSDILEFIGAKWDAKYHGDMRNIYPNDGQWVIRDSPKFYGYFSPYDWVLLCTIFGTMDDLPKGMPMYCIDLKQTFDMIIERKMKTISVYDSPERWEQHYKDMVTYPKQEDEHNASADAEWSYRFYKFLEEIKSYM